MISTLLVVEDDRDLTEYLKELLMDNGYKVKAAHDGASALAKIEESPPDLILLDLGLPDVDGETIFKKIKKMFPDMPVIMLTAKYSATDIVKGFNMGVDDYMGKPFSGEELLARIQARLRDHRGRDAKLIAADLELDTKSLEVKRSGQAINLTQTEIQLLEYLLQNKGQVLTREMILERVWSYSPDIESRVVDVYIGYLRKKIDKGFEKDLIHSVRGFGYILKE